MTYEESKTLKEGDYCIYKGHFSDVIMMVDFLFVDKAGLHINFKMLGSGDWLLTAKWWDDFGRLHRISSTEMLFALLSGKSS